MASKHARRPTSRTRSIETLETRQVMSADPVAQLLGGGVEHHAFQDSADEPPALIHHDQRDADFWIDSWSERDVETLVGDIEQTLASAHNSTGLTQARNDYGFIGTGQTVAIIDSGIAWDHAALGGGFGSNFRVVGGWDFTEENDAVPFDDGPSGSHGTHVAGIVGGDRTGTVDDGVAPGVDLVALRVFNDAGDGYFSWVENALSWVHANRNSFENPITAVNLSLGAAWNSTSIPSWATLEEEFAQLKADGIFIAVSAGNSFATYQTPGLSYPAASPSVVPVMSVKDTGTFSTFSQRHTSAIAAPGQGIVSTVPDYAGNHNGVNDDYASFSGTSMASPYVAGASVLVREAMQFVGYTNITQDTIFNHMMATATTFLDAATNLNYKRLNVSAALDALMPADDYGSTSATAYNLGTLSGSRDFAGLIGKLNDQDFFTFTASATGKVNLAVSATHQLQPNVTVIGSTAAYQDGEWSFDVVAGQSYTVSLATATGQGIGYYSAGLSLEQTIEQPLSIVKTVVRGDGAVFTLDSENWLSINGTRVWQNTQDFTFGSDDSIYWHCTNGYLQHRDNNGVWSTFDDDAIKFGVSIGGTVYSLGNDNWLCINGNKAWQGTQDFELTADQSLYWQSTSGYLQRRDPNGIWHTIDANISKFAVRDDGMVYSLGANDWTKINGCIAWNNTQDFVFTSDQSLYWHCKNGALQQLHQGVWTTVGMDVTRFAVAHDGGQYLLNSDNTVTVNGVQTWSSVVDLRTDSMGSLVLVNANGTMQTVAGRFKVSCGATAQSASIDGQSVQVGGGASTASLSAVAAFAFDTSNAGSASRISEAAFERAAAQVALSDFGARFDFGAAISGGALADAADAVPPVRIDDDALSALWESLDGDDIDQTETDDALESIAGFANSLSVQVAVRTAFDSVFEDIGV